MVNSLSLCECLSLISAAKVRFSLDLLSAPDNLYSYCWSELESRKAVFKCPAINDSKKCNKKWKFCDIVRGACLSVDEVNLFSGFLNQNWFNLDKSIQLCPQCGEAIERSACKGNIMDCLYCRKAGNKSKFCFICTRPWPKRSTSTSCDNKECGSSASRMRSVLKKCKRVRIVNVKGCPSVRACPKCKSIVQFESVEESCKHIKCPACQADFCFICLKVKMPSRVYWPASCGGAFDKCDVAPVQKLE